MSQNSADVGGGWLLDAGNLVCLNGVDLDGSP